MLPTPFIFANKRFEYLSDGAQSVLRSLPQTPQRLRSPKEQPTWLHPRVFDRLPATNRGPDFSYYLEKRMVKEAEQLVEHAFQKEPRSDWAPVNQSLLRALKGEQRAAEAIIPSILKARRNRGHHHVTYFIARIYALGGKSQEALKWLRATVKEGFPCYPLFARDPFLDSIREDPAFNQFMAEMNTLAKLSARVRMRS